MTPSDTNDAATDIEEHEGAAVTPGTPSEDGKDEGGEDDAADPEAEEEDANTDD